MEKTRRCLVEDEIPLVEDQSQQNHTLTYSGEGYCWGTFLGFCFFQRLYFQGPTVSKRVAAYTACQNKSRLTRVDVFRQIVEPRQNTAKPISTDVCWCILTCFGSAYGQDMSTQFKTPQNMSAQADVRWHVLTGFGLVKPRQTHQSWCVSMYFETSRHVSLY